jgi:3-hydroxy-9,10-secoandrosta-1,3,5(10)-triene-9,17-dione monooxygenase
MAPGAALHGPLYCGRIYALYHAGLVIPVVGAARAALEEYEQIITTKLTYFPPQVPPLSQPRRCHIVVVRTTTRSHRRG